jgi:hypothetical protein
MSATTMSITPVYMGVVRFGPTVRRTGPKKTILMGSYFDPKKQPVR